MYVCVYILEVIVNGTLQCCGSAVVSRSLNIVYQYFPIDLRVLILGGCFVSLSDSMGFGAPCL